MIRTAKLTVISLLLLIALLSGCAVRTPSPPPKAEELGTLVEPVSNVPDASPNLKRKASPQVEEVRGVWISYLEMKHLLEKKTEAQFTANVQTAFDNVKNMGLNTVFVQVRPFGDALYKSDYFPWSHTITGVEGKDPGFDPLAIMVAEAHSRGLLIEAWINPYRVRPDKKDNKPLSTGNQAQKWLAAGDRSVVKNGNLISYNPASLKAQNLIVNGVKEIVRNYNVDGIHIDDYFYPVTGTSFDSSFDKTEYNSYKAGGGTKSFGDWRRSNVENLLKKMYEGIKSVNPSVKFGISPQSNLDTNYNQQYLDVAKITSTTDYCDYVAPQIYFGFENTVQPFAETMDKWETIIKEATIDLYVGIASYKVGSHDGKAGHTEWLNNSDICSRQITYARNKAQYKGFILYRYDFIFTPEGKIQSHVEKENQKIRELIQ